MRPLALLAITPVLVALGGPALAQKDKDKGKKAGPREVSVSGKTVSQWAATLKSGKTADKLTAISSLMDAGPEALAAAPALIAIFRNKDESLLHPLAALALARIGPDAVAPLEKALVGDKEPLVRGGAAMALNLLGPLGKAAAPALAKALADGEPIVRATAADALGNLGPAARAALPALRKALDDKDKAVRLAAAFALWKAGGETRGVPVLAGFLKEGTPEQARKAASALGQIGAGAKAAAGAIKEALKHPDSSVRIAAAEALYRVTGSAALETFEAALKDGKPPLRQEALAALAALTAEPKAVALIAGQLDSDDADLRRQAAASLAAPRLKLGKAAQALQAQLKGPDLGVRWWAALALAASGPDVRKQEEDLLAALRAPLARVGDREVPSPQLSDVATPGRAAPALVEVLRRGPARLRIEAARQLAAAGVDVRPVLGDLAEALKTDDKLVRRHVAEAMGRTGVEGLAVLSSLLTSRDPQQREGAARALGFMGVSARSAAGTLMNSLKDPNSAVRAQAALALWFIDANVAQSLPILLLIIKDVDNRDRWEAFEAVGVIAVTARPPIRGLTEIVFDGLKDREARVRVTSAKWLWRRFKEASKVVPLLTSAVSDRDWVVRLIAVETLGELGLDPKAAPLLVSALDDKDLLVRQAAIEGLAREGAKALPALRAALKSKNARTRSGAQRAIDLIGKDGKDK